MPTASILDFDTLLAPVEGDNPAGEDLRAITSHDSPYYKVKDARSSARAAERRAEAPEPQTEAEDRARAAAEWRTVVSLAPQLIASRAKDLEIACWLVEALVRRSGFAGFRDGIMLLRGLVQNFWDGLYPLEDEDGLKTKIAPLVGLLGDGANNPLCIALRKVAITEGEDPGPFASWHYDLALEVEKIVDEEKKQRRIAAGAPTLADFETAFRHHTDDGIRKLRDDGIRNLRDDLEAVIEALNGLGDDLDTCCGVDAPSVSSLRNTVEQILGLVRHLGADALRDDAAVPVAQSSEEPTQGAEVAAARVGTGGGGPIANRDQALAALLEVAEFFRRTEPQSFLPLMLENVVRRGRMSLLDLLADLVPDEEGRKALFLKAGVDLDNQS